MKVTPRTITVSHAKGTTSACPEGSWLQYWKNRTQSYTLFMKCDCCNNSFMEFQMVGAHVVDINTNKTYIHPTCKQCNDTYKESKADEKYFKVKKIYLCPLP